MTNTQLAIQLGGLFLGGATVGGIVGGAMVAGYKAVDAARHLPRWADMIGIGCGYGLAVVGAALLGGYVAPELSEVGERVCEVVGGLGGLAGPSVWPAIQRRVVSVVAAAQVPQDPPQ